MKFNKTFEKVFDEAVTWQQVVIWIVYYIGTLVLTLVSLALGLSEMFEFLKGVF